MILKVSWKQNWFNSTMAGLTFPVGVFYSGWNNHNIPVNNKYEAKTFKRQVILYQDYGSYMCNAVHYHTLSKKLFIVRPYMLWHMMYKHPCPHVDNTSVPPHLKWEETLGL